MQNVGSLANGEQLSATQTFNNQWVLNKLPGAA